MKTTTYCLILITVLLLSCEGPDGPAGIDSLINTTDEPAGTNCAAGGLKVEIGPDSNANGTLDPAEVKSTKYICGGTAGANSLVKTTTENAGTNCPVGGLKIEAGIDANKNGTLDQSEIQTTQFICNGSSGKNSLVTTTSIQPGDDCEQGGIKVDVGVDTNGNGQLESTEIQSTRLICNGVDGASVEEVRFQLISLTAMGSSSATGELSPAWMHLVNFKKSQYSSMTKAKLLAHLSTEGSSGGSITTVDLFNVTDNVAIGGSEVSTGSSTRVWLTSGDCFANIPDKEVEIAVRLRTTGTLGTCVQAYLILSKE